MSTNNFDNDDRLKKILSSAEPEMPSFDFTNRVMAKIQFPVASTAFVYTPVISRNAWIIIFGFVCAIFFAVFMSQQGTPVQQNFMIDYLSKIGSYTDGFISGVSSTFSFLNSLSILLVVLIAGWVLYIFDKLFAKIIPQ